MSCSVIMVSFHTGPVLFASIKSVLEQQGLTELLVVDNGNPPDVLARLQQMALSDPRLQILSGGGNVGVAKGWNVGAKQALGEYLLFLNPDDLLPPGALTGIMDGLAQVPQAVLAGCAMVNPDNTLRPGCRTETLTPTHALLEIFGWRRKQPDAPDAPYELASIPDAFLCIRKQHFEKINGFDDVFFLHGAELDLCLRIRKAGGKVICVPSVRVAHMPSPGDKMPSRFIEWQSAKGLMRYLYKHFDGGAMRPYLWLLDFITVLRFSLRVMVNGLKRHFMASPGMSHTPAAKRLMILASGLAELPQTDEWRGKTVLVTGATSQIGLCVLRRLISSGAAVLAISRSDAIPFQHAHLRWIKGDLTSEALHLDGYLVDIVVHCAPLWHLPSTIDLLADAEVKRVIAFGSTSMYGKALSRNSFEKDVVDKLTKAESEIAERCPAKGIDWTILRHTLVYGVGLDVSITSVAKFIDRFEFFPVYPPAFGKRHPVHADDLAQAVLQAADTPITYGKAYNVSGADVLTYRQMIERIFAACHKKTNIRESTFLPFLLDVAGKLTGRKHLNGEIARRMNDDLIFFHDDATRDFGYRPRPFLADGIKDIEGF